MENEIAPWRARSKYRRTIGHFIALMLGFALAEVGHRAYLWSKGRPHDSRAVRELLLDFASEEVGQDVRLRWRSGGYRIHPYLGFVPPKHQEDLASFKEFSDLHPEVFKVVIFGGSVAESSFNYHKRRFEKLVEAHPLMEGRQVHLVNLALAAHKQPQQLIQLAYLLGLGIVPDVIVNLDGFNELAVAAENTNLKTHPAFPSFIQYAHLAVASSREQESLKLVAGILSNQRLLALRARRALDLGIQRSSLATHLVLPVLQGLSVIVTQGFRKYETLLARPLRLDGGGSVEHYEADRVTVSGPFPRDGFQSPLSALVEIWEVSSINMHALAQAHGSYYLHVLQPTLHDGGSKPLTSKEIESGKTSHVWREAAAGGYPILRETGKRLTQRGVHFLDASFIFEDVEETLYFDACHFVPDGQRILVDAVAEALMDGLEQCEISAGRLNSLIQDSAAIGQEKAAGSEELK